MAATSACPLGRLTPEQTLTLNGSNTPIIAPDNVIVNARTALGTDPVGQAFIRFGLGRNGFSIDHIRADRVLHEALTTGADPLHLSLVFNISHGAAARYASIAEHLLNDELEQPQEQ